MPVIHPALPSNGDDAIVDVYNAAITAILAVLNGGIDTTNIASVAGASIVAASIPMTAMDATVNAGWIPLSQSFTYGTNNGQKEFTVTTNVDLTGIISVGDRFEFTRGTVPPTQAMKFIKSSTQWANKAGPAGYTFTGAFTNEASIFLTSYPSGSGGAIIGRRSGALGANYLRVDSTGQLSILYGDGAGNFTQLQTYQSLPLNQWVHVAGVISSVASKTGALYINGALVDSQSALSAATTLVQAGDLGVGGYTTGLEIFDGYISEARVWSVAQTQSAIQANMGLSLTGSETNLVALFQGNGNFNDKTANANNLSANNGAIATQASNPYHSVEIAIATGVSYVNPTCTLTLFSGTDYMVPNMAILSPKYATVKIPFGFPANREKWSVRSILKIDAAQVSPVLGTWYNNGLHRLAIPAGAWRMFYEGTFYITKGATTIVSGSVTLSTANNTESEPNMTSAGQAEGASGQMTVLTNWHREQLATLAAQTSYYLNIKSNTASAASLTFFGASFSPVIITAECSYL